MADGGRGSGYLGSGWDYLSTCNSSFVEPDRYTYDIEEVTCPECLDMTEREAREKLRRLHVARERVRQIEIEADLAAATPGTLGEWLRRCWR